MSTCPFCGIVTETPHETQKGCLNAEIARMRAVLDQVRSTAAPGATEPEEEDDQEPVQIRNFTLSIGVRR
jgi:hypothetical protein